MGLLHLGDLLRWRRVHGWNLQLSLHPSARMQLTECPYAKSRRFPTPGGVDPFMLKSL